MDGVADFMLNGALEDCKDSVSDNGNVNADIACARGIIDTAATFDPTGILTIASAFMQPVCGQEKAKA